MQIQIDSESGFRLTLSPALTTSLIPLIKYAKVLKVTVWGFRVFLVETVFPRCLKIPKCYLFLLLGEIDGIRIVWMAYQGVMFFRVVIWLAQVVSTFGMQSSK